MCVSVYVCECVCVYVCVCVSDAGLELGEEAKHLRHERISPCGGSSMLPSEAGPSVMRREWVLFPGCGSFLRKGKVLAYAGRIENLEDLNRKMVVQGWSGGRRQSIYASRPSSLRTLSPNPLHLHPPP